MGRENSEYSGTGTCTACETVQCYLKVITG